MCLITRMEVARAPTSVCVRVYAHARRPVTYRGQDRSSANRPSTLEKTLRKREDGPAVRKAEPRINSFGPPLIDLEEDCRVK